MSAAVAIVATPVAFGVLLALLRSSLGARLVAVPTGARWHDRPTPTFGGVGIFGGFAVAAAVAVAVGAVDGSGELWSILGGCALLFAAGLIDDVRHLSPIAKLAAQIGAAARPAGRGHRA
jgi:UDP-N-acetylmuramyl pentapeptide phosphotransferase/UDP-N-acetylglucosamine-1-phosphate transferase